MNQSSERVCGGQADPVFVSLCKYKQAILVYNMHTEQSIFLIGDGILYFIQSYAIFLQLFGKVKAKLSYDFR